MCRELQLIGERQVRLVDAESRPLEAGEVRVRSVLSGISSGTELRHLRRSPAGQAVRPGYELVGRVVEVAGSEDADLVGEMVWLDRPHGDEAIAGAAEARAGRLPAESAAPPTRFAFLARTRTALNAVHDAELRIGDRVLVLGLGGVGLLIARIAVLAGAAEVLAVDPVPARRSLAEGWGARPVAPDELADIAPLGGEVDVVLEASGDPGALVAAAAAGVAHGRIVVVSTYDGGAPAPLPGQRLSLKQQTLAFSTTRPDTRTRGEPRWTHARLRDTARDLLASGRITAEDLATHTMPFERAADAYKLLDERSDGAVAIVLRYGEPDSAGVAAADRG